MWSVCGMCASVWNVDRGSKWWIVAAGDGKWRQVTAMKSTQRIEAGEHTFLALPGNVPGVPVYWYLPKRSLVRAVNKVATIREAASNSPLRPFGVITSNILYFILKLYSIA